MHRYVDLTFSYSCMNVYIYVDMYLGAWLCASLFERRESLDGELAELKMASTGG